MSKIHAHGCCLFLVGTLTGVAGCSSHDVPDQEPTAGDDEDSGTDTGTDTGEEGEEEEGDGDGEPEPEPIACWEPGPNGYEPEDPTLFQCHGEGGGVLNFLQCEKVLGSCSGTCANPGDWTPASGGPDPVEFPPEPPATEPNARACCESDATASQTRDGCMADCARAACKIAIENLEERRDAASTGPFCNQNCVDRTKAGLQHWIDWLNANFDTCVDLTVQGKSINLPSAPGQALIGALACGNLKLDCVLGETDPEDLEETCSTSENEPLEAGGLILECDIEGEVEYDGTEGNDFTTFEATVTVRRQSPCTTDTCWFSMESIEIDADAFASGGFIGRDMHGSLAYQGFGSFDSSTDEGMLAEGMFGIDVAMQGSMPSSSFQNYAFRMANSGDAVFEVSSGQFEIIDAHFVWDDHELTITSDPGSCVCINCTL